MAALQSIWDVLPKQLMRPSIADIPLEDDPFWSDYEYNGIGASIHLAILAKKYLDLILEKSKTIESRFSIHKRIPYNRIKSGDIILLKETSGLIQGIGYVTSVDFVQLSNNLTFDIIKEKYGEGLQIQDETYWERYSRSRYGTLIHLDHVRQINPMPFSKNDRNAWVIFELEKQPL